MAAASESASVERLGPYVLVRVLAEGGMGAVYDARHEGLGKRVAVKVLHPSVLSNADAVARFLREGEAASRLRHPHVVDVTDVGRVNDIPFMVMEFLEGESLGDRIERDGRIPFEEALAIAAPVASALVAIHDEGIVHRDLKPDNVFLARNRFGDVIPKIVDFGISKISNPIDASMTATNALMGTPYYLPPEQARGAKNVDARADQYAFGLIVYEMLTGRRAVDGESLLEILHQIHIGRRIPLSECCPELDPAFVAVVDRMLAQDREGRFPSMREAGAALLAFASDGATMKFATHFAPHGASVASPPDVARRPIDSHFRVRESVTTEAIPTRRVGRATSIGVAAAIAIVALVGIGTVLGVGDDPAPSGGGARTRTGATVAESAREPDPPHVSEPPRRLEPAEQPVVVADVDASAPTRTDEPADARRARRAPRTGVDGSPRESVGALGATADAPPRDPGAADVRRGANRSVILR